MKKLHKITAALASLAVAVSAFTGCADSHTGDDYEPVAVPAYLVGGIYQADVDSVTAEKNGDNYFFPLTFQTVDGEKIAEFTWKQDCNHWGAGLPTDTQDFKLSLENGWNASWENSEELTLNSDYAEVSFGSPDKKGNITLSGLKQGESYTMKIKIDGAKVLVKVEGKEEEFTELTLIADGIPLTMDRLNGTYTSTVSASSDSLPFVIYDGEKTWGLKSADANAFAFDTEYTCEEVKAPTSLSVTNKHSYKFTATLTADGTPKVTVADLKPIALKSIVGDFTGDDTAVALTVVSEGAIKNVYSYTVTPEATGGWGYAGGLSYKLSFGAAGTTKDNNYWNETCYGANADSDANNAAKPDGDAVKLKKNPGDDNARVDVEVGKTYLLIVTTTADEVSVQWISTETVAVKVKVTVTLDNTLAAEDVLTLNSNISWGGAKGKWSADGTNFHTKSLFVKPTDNKVDFYISKDYEISGWAVDEKLDDTNFKFEIGEDTGDPKGGWFKIDASSDISITYSEKKN
ncbi:MAG: hypothetical protein IJ727_12445 [Treponema sp.]|nr:hypothetical protein [Treponema sp.]